MNQLWIGYTGIRKYQCIEFLCKLVHGVVINIHFGCGYDLLSACSFVRKRFTAAFGLNRLKDDGNCQADPRLVSSPHAVDLRMKYL